MRQIVPAYVLFLVVGGVLAGSASGHSLAPNIEAQHCAVQLDPVIAGEKFSRAVDLGCYVTLAEAQRAGLASSPARSSRGLLPARRSVGSPTLSTDYANASFSGATLTWSASNGIGCVNGASFSQPVTGSWNNAIRSSLRVAAAGCGSNRHYDPASASGTSIDCSCATMGGMAAKTSFEQWTP